MIDLVNAERRKAGVPELKVSPKLCEAARIRAKEVTVKPSHTRPNGTDCDTVLIDVGLNISLLNGGTIISHGENLTLRSRGSFSAIDGFNNFMKSSSHKKNILNTNYSYVGIAKYRSTNGSTSWIQTFVML